MHRAALALLLLSACSKPPPPPAAPRPPPVVSQDILVRPVQTSVARVQHILIAWADLKSNYKGPMDRRAAARDRANAEELVRSVLKRVHDGDPFEQLMREYSEDLDSARVSGSYEVKPDGQMEPAFQSLALRLNVGEVGVCETVFGFHVVKRIQ